MTAERSLFLATSPPALQHRLVHGPGNLVFTDLGDGLRPARVLESGGVLGRGILKVYIFGDNYEAVINETRALDFYSNFWQYIGQNVLRNSLQGVRALGMAIEHMEHPQETVVRIISQMESNQVTMARGETPAAVQVYPPPFVPSTPPYFSLTYPAGTSTGQRTTSPPLTPTPEGQDKDRLSRSSSKADNARDTHGKTASNCFVCPHSTGGQEKRRKDGGDKKQDEPPRKRSSGRRTSAASQATATSS